MRNPANLQFYLNMNSDNVTLVTDDDENGICRYVRRKVPLIIKVVLDDSDRWVMQNKKCLHSELFFRKFLKFTNEFL